MKIIFGLGNIGSKYDQTRHNVGFMFVDYLANKYNGSFVSKSKLKADVCEIFIDSHKVLLVKPSTFMNLSGDCVRAVFDFYKVSLDDLLIVFDDIDLPFGSIRYRKSGGAGTHNGMRDIVSKIGMKEFPRLKIGIEIENRPHDLAAFVLSRFSNLELEDLDSLFLEGFDQTMNNFLDFSEKKS